MTAIAPGEAGTYEAQVHQTLVKKESAKTIAIVVRSN